MLSHCSYGEDGGLLPRYSRSEGTGFERNRGWHLTLDYAGCYRAAAHTYGGEFRRGGV